MSWPWTKIASTNHPFPRDGDYSERLLDRGSMSILAV